jgi:hypothetical protein
LSVNERAKTVPRRYKTQQSALPIPQYYPPHKQVLQGKKSPEMTPGIYSFLPYTVTPTNRQKGMLYAENEQQAAAVMELFPEQ